MMKASLMLLSTASASLYVWDQQQICDGFSMSTVDFEVFTDWTQSECLSWCYQQEREAFPSIPYGQAMCCDYEKSTFDDVSCTLYKGNKLMRNTCLDRSTCDDLNASIQFNSS